MQTLVVEPRDDGKKLITYLTSKYPKLKISTLRKALRQKDIKVNDRRVSNEIVLNTGDELIVYISDNLLFDEDNKFYSKIETVYEDGNMVVFNKPTGMEVEGKNSLSEIMSSKYQFLKACHRIDRNTTGLVLFAKNKLSLYEIEEAFKVGKIEKHYMACCYGIPKKDETLEAYLFKDRKKSQVYISNEYKKGYVKIKTSYKVLESNPKTNLSLLNVTLHTGRTHQIRAHLAFAGFPILGDGKYGSNKVNRKFKINKQALCSYSITFNNMNKGLGYLNHKQVKLSEIPFAYIISQAPINI